MRPSLIPFAIAVFALLATVSAHADVTATCTLQPDRRTVTVAFTNPSPRTMQCEVNCNMGVAGGIGTVVCVKPVPANAANLVMCSETSERVAYTRVKDQEVNCRDPDGTPVTPEQQKAQEEDSEKLGEQIRQQSLDMLKQLQQMQKGQ
jgi:hypothetical protein